MKTRPFKQVDVFTGERYRGNPLAVVLDGSDLSNEAMQHFARWTNLSETVFLLPPTLPGADYRVRIFTPGAELAFAGHPTLGACHAWLAAGGQPRHSGAVVQQCEAGLVNIRPGEAKDALAFEAPPLKRRAPSPSLLARVAAALGLKASQIVAAQCLDNGTPWLGILVNDVATVMSLRPDHRALKEIGQKIGVAALIEQAEETAAPALIGRSNREARAFVRSAPAVPEAQLEVRAFAAAVGIEEDPVTGSLNASLAQWLMAEGHLPERYIAAQGDGLDRAGRVHVERDAQGRIWIGGQSVTCIDGSVTL